MSASKRIKLQQDNAESKKVSEKHGNHPYNKSSLDIDKAASSARLTKIVCTIGPTSRTPEILQEMIQAGMNIARLNFSHGTHEYHAESIANVRLACTLLSKKTGRTASVAIALDTTGTEIRTGLLEGGATAEVEIKTGDILLLTSNKAYSERSNQKILYVGYPNIEKQKIQPGTTILIDDGLIKLTYEGLDKNFMKCIVNHGGLLGSRKGIYFQNLVVDLPIISEKDKSDIAFGIEQGIDMIFASFMRSAEAFREIREFLGEKGKNILLFSKIESRIGIDNMDEIIDVSDGIMIDRGDLGTEIPLEKVFVAQKAIVDRCNKTGTPIIIATQLLESMISMPKPSRSDVSDIANAVLDGSDCVMLSGETAKGSYPIECVKVMDSVCREAEAIICPQKSFNQLLLHANPPTNPADSAAVAAVQASIHSSASAIIVLTRTGTSARLIAKYRPKSAIIAITKDAKVARGLLCSRGIIPFVYQESSSTDWTRETELRIEYGIKCGKELKLVENGDYIITVSGSREGPGATNSIRILFV